MNADACGLRCEATKRFSERHDARQTSTTQPRRGLAIFYIRKNRVEQITLTQRKGAGPALDPGESSAAVASP